MAIRFLADKSFGEKYIKESPKAFIRRKMFGEEKAYKLTQRIFAALGVVVSLGLILTGTYIFIEAFIS